MTLRLRLRTFLRTEVPDIVFFGTPLDWLFDQSTMEVHRGSRYKRLFSDVILPKLPYSFVIRECKVSKSKGSEAGDPLRAH
jgi:hypothetical protein